MAFRTPSLVDRPPALPRTGVKASVAITGPDSGTSGAGSNSVKIALTVSATTSDASGVRQGFLTRDDRRGPVHFCQSSTRCPHGFGAEVDLVWPSSATGSRLKISISREIPG